MTKLPPGEVAFNPESLDENLIYIKDQLLKGELNGVYKAPNNIQGFKVEKIYDTGNEPETGTSRDDDAIIKLTGADDSVYYAKVNYFARSNSIHNVVFMEENEANEFVTKEQQYFSSSSEI